MIWHPIFSSLSEEGSKTRQKKSSYNHLFSAELLLEYSVYAKDPESKLASFPDQINLLSQASNAAELTPDPLPQRFNTALQFLG